MNIIFNQGLAEELATRHIVLPLDRFYISATQESIQSFCVIESPLLYDLAQVPLWTELHKQILQDLACQKWQACVQNINALMGKWNGELDSFYQNLLDRIGAWQSQSLASDWSPVIIK